MAIAVAFVLLDVDTGDFSFGGSDGLKANDVNGGTFSSTGSLYSLSWTNYLYDCSQEGELFILVDGQWVKVVSDSDFFNTVIGADIQRRATGQTINDFRVDTYLTCDYPNSGVKKLEVGGNTQYAIYTGSSTDKLIKSQNVNIPTKVLPDNTRVKVSQYQFTADSIESQLIITSTTGSGWVHALAQVNGAYIMTFDDGSIQFATATQETVSPVSQMSFYVNVVDTPVEVVPDANRANEPIFISDIIQVKSNTSVMGKTMDLDRGQQIKIKATMRNYVDTDGLPQVTITGPGVNVKINLLLKGFENDNDGLFENNFLLPRDNNLGDWSVKLTHDQRSGTSTRGFNTIDTGITTTTSTTGETQTTTSEGQIIQTSADTGAGSDTTGLDGPTAITKMHYIHRYDQVPDCNISTNECKLTTKTVSGILGTQSLQLTSLTDSISFGGQTGVEAILDEVQITTVVSADFEVLKELKRATHSDQIYQATLSPVGSSAFSFTPFTIHSPQPNICYGVTNESSCPPNGGMQLDIITISNEKIEQELAKKNINPEGQKVKLSVTAIDGTFTVIDGANKEHIGSSKGSTYEYTFTYGATSVNTGSGNNVSSADSCTSSDPSVGCECPTGETLSYSTTLNKLVCVDPDTGNETVSQPTSDPNQTPDPEFVDNVGGVEPHCEVDQNNNVIATFGNVSIDDPNCANLFGTASDQQTVIENSDGTIEATPDSEAQGSGIEQPLISCEETLGVDFCALASSPGDLFTEDGVDGEDLSATIVGVIIAIIVIMIAIGVAMKKRRNYY